MQRHSHALVAAAALSCLTFAAPAAVDAQSLGFGPQFALVRGDVNADSSTRYLGVLLRFHPSPRTARSMALLCCAMEWAC